MSIVDEFIPLAQLLSSSETRAILGNLSVRTCPVVNEGTAQ